MQKGKCDEDRGVYSETTAEAEKVVRASDCSVRLQALTGNSPL